MSYQVDATIESAEEVESKLEEIWEGQPANVAEPREFFDEAKSQVAKIIETAGLGYPVHVTVSSHKRGLPGPDQGWATISVREAS